MISDIANLKDNFVREFLLNVEIPFLHIWRFQIVLNTRDVERWLRSARPEDGHANAERNGSTGYNREAGGWAGWILSETFLKIIERNRIVIDSKAGPNHRLFARKNLEGRLPCEGKPWAKIAFGRVIEMPARELRSLDQAQGRIAGREAVERF